MNKLYHEEMEDCPCQQGLRCSMNGEFCKEENCGPGFVFGRIYYIHFAADEAIEKDGDFCKED